jgi:hypothetical protein
MGLLNFIEKWNEYLFGLFAIIWAGSKFLHNRRSEEITA